MSRPVASVHLEADGHGLRAAHELGFRHASFVRHLDRLEARESVPPRTSASRAARGAGRGRRGRRSRSRCACWASARAGTCTDRRTLLRRGSRRRRTGRAGRPAQSAGRAARSPPRRSGRTAAPASPSGSTPPRSPDQRGIRLELREQLRLLGQDPHRGRGRRRGRVVPGGRGDDVVRDHRPLVHRAAVHLAVRDQRGDVAARAGAPVADDCVVVFLELAVDDVPGLDDLGRVGDVRAGPAQVGIGVREQPLRQPQHLGVVLARHADDVEDHLQRVEEGHVGREVAARRPCPAMRSMWCRAVSRMPSDRASSDCGMNCACVTCR